MAKSKTGSATVRTVSLSEIKLDKKNVRVHDERSNDALAKSLQRFGAARSVVIDKDGRVRAGNGTLAAAKKAGIKEAIIVEADGRALVVVRRPDWDKQQAEAYALADNRTGELSTWDFEGLTDVLKILDDKTALGWDDDALTALLSSEFRLPTNDVDAEPQIDRAEELRKEWKVEAGQMWQLGDHRLLCGDSTNADCVSALMVNDRAAACITDPPYSVNYDRSQEERGGNAGVHGHYHEGETSPDGILAFMALVPSDVMVWSYPIDRHFHALSDAYRKHGWELKKELVWVKDSFSFWMSAKYQQKHEPMMLATRKGKPIGGNVPSTATTVFEYPRPRAHELHPTMKPIELWCELIKNHSSAAEIIYEPFSGSGTTIIACEQLGRKCRAIELSPGYVAVALQRFKDATGKTPTLEGHGS